MTVKVLVILPNHELPPRIDSPGISFIVHNQIDRSKFKIHTFSINSFEKGNRIVNSRYQSTIAHRFIFEFVKSISLILGKRLRKRIFDVYDYKKFSRLFIVNLYHLFMGRKYDVVIYHNYIESLKFGRLISSLHGNRLIYYFHSSGLDKKLLNQRIWLSSIDGLVTISGEKININVKSQVNIINNYKKSKYSIKSRDLNILKFLYVGVLDKNKNCRLVIDLFLDFNNSTTMDCELHIFGEIKDVNYYKDFILPRLNSHQTSIKYFGLIGHDDLINLLVHYDYVFQLSNTAEGNPMALIEAMVEGNVVPIGSSVGGIPLVLKNGDFGLIIDLDEDFQMISNKIKQFILEEELTKRCFNNIEKYSTSYFSPNTSAEKLDDFLEVVVSSDHSPKSMDRSKSFRI
jgi:glycosyltransferase involved in cell wall biosynthesis